MKKSKLETAETRKRIVSVASKIFLEQGLAATGIADIMLAAGLTPGGFYRHFASKEQLIAEANSAASKQLLDLFEAAAAGKPPREALDIVVCLYLNDTEQASALCPLANLGSELRHADSNVKSVAMDGYQRMLSFVTAQTRQLDLPDYAGVADAVVSTMIGAVTLSRLAGDGAMARTILANAQRVVGGLLHAAPAPQPGAA